MAPWRPPRREATLQANKVSKGMAMTTATAEKTATHGEPRRVVAVIRGIPTSDGAGVKLTRVIGQRALPDLDPFLMLDEFFSDDSRGVKAEGHTGIRVHGFW